MIITVIGSKEARIRWRDLLDGADAGRDTVIERSGRRVAVLIPYEDYEAILEELEDRRADRRATEADGNRKDHPAFMSAPLFHTNSATATGRVTPSRCRLMRSISCKVSALR